ncbi:hypothetical protein [Streptosporangium roseum]|uniref:Uncharacterized protein n=1 Tax=Streptosporangium roseum (strain ATCC 12428 / DSM 43021 / JCM 3005 / KCTC 9067 / NCIMB 10171 / NRRL 2505 / NI 9100) TaxID=479432 RepID=D2BA76_STRRD|nr:hypothetical protein [Streptosporangium roseum]ACZ87901.1 hypothetical protein Sros_5118 [Streptosporangium roseum DSM 43021]
MLQNRHVGCLQYLLCHDCRRGLVAKISIDQDAGIVRRVSHNTGPSRRPMR